MRHRLIELTDGPHDSLGSSLGSQTAKRSDSGKRRRPRFPTPAFLDFRAIEIATASFLREAVIGFRDYTRQSLRNIYPAVANLEPAVAEELDFFVRARGDVMWSCELDPSDTVISARLVGELEPAQRSTFEAALEVGTITAPETRSSFHRPADRSDRLEQSTIRASHQRPARRTQAGKDQVVSLRSWRLADGSLITSVRTPANLGANVGMAALTG